MSPGAASPPTVPVTFTVPPASAAFTISSAVMLSTAIVAVLVVSTVCVEVPVIVNGLPASSVPVTVVSKVVSAAKSEPATGMLYVLSACTTPLYSVPLMVRLTVSPGPASGPTLPVTSTLPPDSTALTISSAVILSTVIVAVLLVSTVKGRLVSAVKLLPALSVPVTVAMTVPSLSAAMSAAGITTLKLLLSVFTVVA